MKYLAVFGVGFAAYAYYAKSVENGVLAADVVVHETPFIALGLMALFLI